MTVDKTKRILTIYCLFNDCEEVEYREITDYISVSKKTIQRDMHFLKQAGLIRYTFDRKAKAFIPQKAIDTKPIFPKNTVKRRYMERIIRLCRIITNIDGVDDPIEWYNEQFPGLSARTRQRDFLLLNELGVCIKYCPTDGFTAGYWQCNFSGAYSLRTITKNNM